MTDTEKQLWRAVEAEPTDDAAKLALADALRDCGQDDLAAVVVWCVSQRRWPRMQWADWQWTHGRPRQPLKQTNILPSPWYEETKKARHFDTNFGPFDCSLRGQLLLLTAAMVRLREQLPREWLR